VALELHQTRKVKLLAQALREHVASLGFDLPPGDSAQRLVAAKVEEIGNGLGVTPRTVLNSYLTEDSIRAMARSLARQMKGMTAVLDDAPPIQLDTFHGHMVLAAFGMCGSLALRNLDHPSATIVLKDAADSTVHVAVALADQEHEPREISGLALSIARKVITMVLELLQSDQWPCGCCPSEDAESETVECKLRRRLTADLASLGGWAPPRTLGE
jgi:hypothetical protein